jgi:pimeloyl-ACP methyl ester carboxylesterase
MSGVQTKIVELGRGLQGTPVLTKGDGPALVYLHGLMGQAWDPLLDGLARSWTVYAPALAGAEEPDELKAFDSIHDLVLYLDDVLRSIRIDRFVLVGHSFGGMLAAEYAAHFPERVSKLVLIDPLGLWRDDAPVADFLYLTPEKQARLVLGEVDAETIKAVLALPNDPHAKVRESVRRITSMASILHFTWPIPERGLSKRLHRIEADTLLVWGAQDKLVPKIYAEDFGAALRRSSLEVIEGAGHTPQFAKAAAVLDSLHRFLAA